MPTWTKRKGDVSRPTDESRRIQILSRAEEMFRQTMNWDRGVILMNSESKPVELEQYPHQLYLQINQILAEYTNQTRKGSKELKSEWMDDHPTFNFLSGREKINLFDRTYNHDASVDVESVEVSGETIKRLVGTVAQLMYPVKPSSFKKTVSVGKKLIQRISHRGTGRSDGGVTIATTELDEYASHLVRSLVEMMVKSEKQGQEMTYQTEIWCIKNSTRRMFDQVGGKQLFSDQQQVAGLVDIILFLYLVLVVVVEDGPDGFAVTHREYRDELVELKDQALEVRISRLLSEKKDVEEQQLGAAFEGYVSSVKNGKQSDRSESKPATVKTVDVQVDDDQVSPRTVSSSQVGQPDGTVEQVNVPNPQPPKTWTELKAEENIQDTIAHQALKKPLVDASKYHCSLMQQQAVLKVVHFVTENDDHFTDYILDKRKLDHLPVGKTVVEPAGFVLDPSTPRLEFENTHVDLEQELNIDRAQELEAMTAKSQPVHAVELSNDAEVSVIDTGAQKYMDARQDLTRASDERAREIKEGNEASKKAEPSGRPVWTFRPWAGYFQPACKEERNTELAVEPVAEVAEVVETTEPAAPTATETESSVLPPQDRAITIVDNSTTADSPADNPTAGADKPRS